MNAPISLLPLTTHVLTATTNLAAADAGKAAAAGVVVGMLFAGALTVSTRLIVWWLQRRLDHKRLVEENVNVTP